jgi:Phosphodiester glycosidase
MAQPACHRERGRKTLPAGDPKFGLTAGAGQTLISDHVVAYGPWGASLLWFDAELAPHVLGLSSAARPTLRKWAVGAHVLQLHDGPVLEGGDATVNPRTAIGIDQARKFLLLVVAERISQPGMLHILADLGARDGILLDGGRLERNGDRAGQHRDSSRRIVGEWPAGGYLHRGAGAAMLRRVLRLIAPQGLAIDSVTRSIHKGELPGAGHRPADASGIVGPSCTGNSGR